MHGPADDILVLKDPEHPDWMWGASVSEVDGRYLEVGISKDSSRVRAPFPPCASNRDRVHSFYLALLVQKYLMWVADLQAQEIGPNLKWIKLVNEFDSSYDMFVLPALWT